MKDDAAIGDPECPLCYGVGYVTEHHPIESDQFGKVFACECRAQEIAEAAEQATALLPSEQSITLDSLIARGGYTKIMVEEVKRFAEKPYGMITLWGGPGNGKTISLMALTNHFKKQFPAQSRYVRFKDLIDYIRAGNAPDASEDAIARYEQMKHMRFLAIDELEKVRDTKYAYEFRSAFLDDRYRYARERDENSRLYTAFAMNSDPLSLPDHIYDRLQWGRNTPDGFRIIQNKDSSARPAGL